MPNNLSSGKTESFVLADGWAIHIGQRDEDTWLISFRDGQGRSKAAPSVEALAVEAISSDQVVRNLKLRSGETTDTIVASGWLEFVTHVRMALKTPAETLRRQHRLSDAKPVVAEKGPRGGSIADMGHGASVELLRTEGERWSLVFYENNVEVAAPAAELIKIELIDGLGGIVILSMAQTKSASTLISEAGGKDCTRIRISWWHGDHAHRREFDLPLA